MHDIHYNYIMKKHRDHEKLLFTDTNSLTYEIVGMIKNEDGGNIIKEFIGLRAKLNTYKMFVGSKAGPCGPKKETKYKGIKRAVIKDTTDDDYKECLFSGNMQMRKMNVIRSHGHEVFTESINKIPWSANENKRIIREEKI